MADVAAVRFPLPRGAILLGLKKAEIESRLIMSKVVKLVAALCVVGGIAGAGYVYLPGLLSPAPQPFTLLNAEELDQRLSLGTDQGAERSLSITVSDGPGIRVAAPSGTSLYSPVDFDIQLQPKDGVAVDMKSLKIEYKIGPAWINLTRRIMGQASIKGNRFFARGAELPSGRHSLRLSVRDVQGRSTQARVSFSVSGDR